MNLSPEQLAFVQRLLPLIGWLLLAVLLDVLLGVINALRSHAFQWQKLADFLGDYGSKALGWLALECLDLLPAGIAGQVGLGNKLGGVAYFVLMAAAIGSILGHVQALGLLPMSLHRVGLPPTNKTIAAG